MIGNRLKLFPSKNFISFIFDNFFLSKRVFIVCTTWLCFFQLSAQDISTLLQDYDKNFEKTIQSADRYFQRKHRGAPVGQYSRGALRDGDYVKYQRWKSYWEFYKTPIGHLKSISEYYAKGDKAAKRSNQPSNPYASRQWSNISNDLYIGTQIGLGRTTSMGFHPTNPDIFYVGAAIGGIWKTTNGGVSYVPLGDNLPHLSISAIVVNENNPDNIFIALSDHVWYGPYSIGIYETTDGGLSWHPTAYTTVFTDNVQIFDIISHPDDPDIMFVATSKGLLQTQDGFATYSQINNVNTTDLAFNPTQSNVIYQIGTNGEFLRSTNNGASFTLMTTFSSNTTFNRIGTTQDNPSVVYALSGTQVHKSTNSGASFTALSNSMENNGILVVDPNDENSVLCGYFNTSLSGNGGTSFAEITHWLGDNGLPLIHVDQRNAFSHPLRPDEVLINNDGGVYKYKWSDDTFENLSNGLIITQFYDIAVSQTDTMIVSGGSQDNGSMYRRSDGVWQEFAATGDGMITEIDPTDANIRYWEYQHGVLNKWSSGININISPPGESGNGAWETPYKLDPNNPNRIVIGYKRVYESNNQGQNWTAISNELSSGRTLDQIAIAPSNSNRIYTTQNDNLFVKEVNSNNWMQKATPLSERITDIEVDPSDMNIVYITYIGYFDGQKVYKSTNAGDTWQNISGSLPNVPVGAIETYRDISGAIFIGTDAGVYYRDNSLSDWLEYGNFVHTSIRDLEIQYPSQKLRAGTHGRGIYETAILIEQCNPSDPDTDDDGVCDLFDVCPSFDDKLIGQPCDDNNPVTIGESHTVDCNCEGGFIATSYCAAQGASGTGGDWISAVRLNTIQNTSGQSGYSNFTNIRTDLTQSETYTLTVELNATFSLDKIYTWIDYNHDGVFNNTSELINFPSINSNIGSVTFTVPNDAMLGITTMRVRVIYADPNNPEPCGSIFGEVEDYGVELFANNTTQVDSADLADVCTSTPCHIISSNIYLGTGITADNMPIANATATGDTDDGINIPSSINITSGRFFRLPINMYNNTGNTAFLKVWVDWNNDGDFEEANEAIVSNTYATSNYNGIYTDVITFNVPTNLSAAQIGLRLRYSTDNALGACGTGICANDGEVEDYLIPVVNNKNNCLNISAQLKRGE